MQIAIPGFSAVSDTQVESFSRPALHSSVVSLHFDPCGPVVLPLRSSQPGSLASIQKDQIEIHGAEASEAAECEEL